MGNKKTEPIVAGLLCLVLGLGSLIWGSIQLAFSWSSTSWPTVEGTVVASDLEVKQRTSGRTGNQKTTFIPRVEYTYEVAGTAYKASRISFVVRSSNDRNDMERLLEHYSEGGTVHVRYNPARPELAVLEPQVAATTFLFIGLGVLFTAIGGFFLLAGLRAGRHQAHT